MSGNCFASRRRRTYILDPTDCRAVVTLRRRGFSLLELMVMVAIIAIIGMVAIPQIREYKEYQNRLDLLIAAFPWPPPQASGAIIVPRKLLLAKIPGKPTLGNVQARLERALDQAGYSDKSYFAVPDGFAVITRLEQFADSGAPKAGAERWSPETGPLKRFNVRDYLSALFHTRAGRFRVIAFVVTPRPFSQANIGVTRDEANRWLSRGANKLPLELFAAEYTEAHDCTALIFEFSKTGLDMDAVLMVPGTLPAREHLVRAKVWLALEEV